MSDQTVRAIEKTLRYGALFNFPLTEEELRQYLIGVKAPGRVIPTGNFHKVGEYFTLRGREALVPLRQKNTNYTQKKIARAVKLSNWLRIFPGVRMVGLTGSVAARNAGPSDDIDLMIVTAPGRIWLTRATVLSVLSLAGLKRPDREGGYFDNQFCFNLWLEDSPYGLRIHQEDLYTAYEVCLMKPLLGGETYLKFLRINGWYRKFLPNFNPTFGMQLIQDSRLLQDLGHVAQYIIEISTLHILGWILEPLASFLSRRRITAKHQRGYHPGVRVSNRQLMFHPDSPRERILEQIS